MFPSIWRHDGSGSCGHYEASMLTLFTFRKLMVHRQLGTLHVAPTKGNRSDVADTLFSPKMAANSTHLLSSLGLVLASTEDVWTGPENLIVLVAFPSQSSSLKCD